jgi:hypothetical protein
MALSDNIPHFGGDSHCAIPMLSNEDLVGVNTGTAKIISIHGKCPFIMLIILVCWNLAAIINFNCRKCTLLRELLSAVDINDPRVLPIYGQLFHFRETATELELFIHEPDRLQQVTLCTLAHNLDLQYEYCLRLRRARITRFSELERVATDASMRHAHTATELPAMSYQSDGSYNSGIQTHYSPSLRSSVDGNGQLGNTRMFPTSTAFTHSADTSLECQIPSGYDFQNGFSNLQHIQDVQQNASLHQFEIARASSDDKELGDLLYLHQANVAVIAPWHHPSSIASSKRSTPSVCSGSSSHRSTPSFRKKIAARSTSKSLGLYQYCGEFLKWSNFLGIYECLCTNEMRTYMSL